MFDWGMGDRCDIILRNKYINVYPNAFSLSKLINDISICIYSLQPRK